MKNIALIFGGKSAEHEVSVITAKQIYNGYTKEEFNILPIFLDKENQFFLVKDFTDLSEFAKSNLNSKIFTKVKFEIGSNKLYKSANRKEICVIDACINACHGGIGENGNLVALFEMCNIPISSGDTMALAVGFDKVASKLICKASDIDVLDCIWFYKEEWENAPTKILNDLSKQKYPLIVKPARQGSSIGVTVAHNARELISAVKLAFEFDNKVLIEKSLQNYKEFNCSAIGFAGGQIETSKVDEPQKIHEILSFEDKYVNGGKSSDKNNKLDSCSCKFNNEKNLGIKGSLANAKREFTKDLKLETKIKAITEKVMRIHNLSGVIRVDYLFDIKKKKLYFNEVNTVPGSLSFYFWAKENLDINALVEKLVSIAQTCFMKKFELKNEYITKLL